MITLRKDATELDFLIATLQRMREIQNKPRGVIEAQYFESDIQRYFRLPVEMTSSFVYDTLLRLSSLPAGSSVLRDIAGLERLHDMQNGAYFRLDTRLCLLDSHHRVKGAPESGYFTWHYATDFRPQTTTYEEAWTMIEEGRLTFGRDA